MGPIIKYKRVLSSYFISKETKCNENFQCNLGHPVPFFITIQLYVCRHSKATVTTVISSFGNMLLFRAFLLFGCLFANCSSQGAPWSEEDTLIIHKKLTKLIVSPGQVRKKYLKLHPEAPNYHRKTNPNAQKVSFIKESKKTM